MTEVYFVQYNNTIFLLAGSHVRPETKKYFQKKSVMKKKIVTHENKCVIFCSHPYPYVDK